MKILVKTLAGLEEVLKKEIEDLGGKNIRAHKRAVSCEGDMDFVYKANIYLRTALRVLVPIFEFEAKDEHELYKNVYDFDWTQYLRKHQTFAIDNTVFSQYFKHSKYAALKTKDAIVDQFRKKFDERPSINVESPDIQLNLHAWNEKFSISLDSSGKPLNQRGYRDRGHQAPLNEVLAAGMILMSGWTPDKPLLDPMCGTGTILMEAAMIAYKIPPNAHRKDFGFKTWNDFEPMKWHRTKMDAESYKTDFDVSITGIEINPGAFRMANKTLKHLKLDRKVKVKRMDFFDYKPVRETEGVIICNPPYGERIGEEIEEMYKKIGDHLKQNFKNQSVWLLSSNKAALKQIGLQTEERIALYNGSLDCEYCNYKIY